MSSTTARRGSGSRFRASVNFFRRSSVVALPLADTVDPLRICEVEPRAGQQSDRELSQALDSNRPALPCFALRFHDPIRKHVLPFLAAPTLVAHHRVAPESARSRAAATEIPRAPASEARPRPPNLLLLSPSERRRRVRPACRGRRAEEILRQNKDSDARALLQAPSRSMSNLMLAICASSSRLPERRRRRLIERTDLRHAPASRSTEIDGHGDCRDRQD